MGSASETPLGRRAFHPIYEACVRHDLPLALHVGGEGAGMSPPATAVGHPASTFEWYGALPQTYMAHLMSMVTEGVFERFPTLKVVLYEAGIFWLPHVMWRFDKNWKAQRSETPWVKEPPSAYLRRHVYFTSYPLELPPDAADAAPGAGDDRGRAHAPLRQRLSRIGSSAIRSRWWTTCRTSSVRGSWRRMRGRLWRAVAT